MKIYQNHITLIGCPKLDDVDYSEKLTQIIANNNIKSITIVRMEVPCCGGIEYAVKRPFRTAESSCHGSAIRFRLTEILLMNKNCGMESNNGK